MKTKAVSNFITGYKGDQADNDDTFTAELEQEQKMSGNLLH